MLNYRNWELLASAFLFEMLMSCKDPLIGGEQLSLTMGSSKAHLLPCDLGGPECSSPF
jgi:hypothetical protein